MVNKRKMWCCRKNKGMARHKINKRKKEEMRYRLDEFLKSCSHVLTSLDRSWRLWHFSDTCKEQASVSGAWCG